MTRGPQPVKTFSSASEIGGRRGTVKWFDRADTGGCLFSIFGLDIVSVVQIRRTKRLRVGPEEISRDFSDTIAHLKVAVLTRYVIPELWLCSYQYSWRFFQVTGGDLAELDRDGRPVGMPCIAPSKNRF